MNLLTYIYNRIFKFNKIDLNTKIGENVKINNYVEIRKNVSIGDNCYIDSGVCITGDAKIGNDVTLRNNVIVARGSEIGDGSFLAPRVMFNNLDFGGKKIGGASIGKNCFIGTHTVLHHGITICDNVVIGAMSFVNKDITEPGFYVGSPAKKITKGIDPSAKIHPDVKIGDNVYIGAGCIIGYPAEYKSYWPESKYSVVIEDGAIITGNVTIDAGVMRDTIIGNNSFLMKGVHVGHDAVIHKDVTLSCHSIIGGESEIYEGANLGLNVLVHQKQKIGHYSMLGMGTVVTKKTKIEPFKKYVGVPAKEIGINEIVIENNKFTKEDISRIKNLF